MIEQALGYKPKNKIKFLTNFFITPSSVDNTSYITCFSCGKIGQKAFVCNTRKLNGKIVKRIWIPKGTIATNPKGSKKTWVPKTVI